MAARDPEIPEGRRPEGRRADSGRARPAPSAQRRPAPGQTSKGRFAKLATGKPPVGGVQARSRRPSGPRPGGEVDAGPRSEGRSGPGRPRRAQTPGAKVRGPRPNGVRDDYGSRASRSARPAGRQGSPPPRYEPPPAVPGWGRVARKGVRGLTPNPDAVSEPRPVSVPPVWEPEQWDRVDATQAPKGRISEQRAGPAANPPPRVRKRPGGKVVSDAVVLELAKAVGGLQGGVLARRLGDATSCLERERVAEALRILRPLAKQVPEVAAVRELTGLALYRTGRWAEATKELEVYARLSGSADQHHVLADCWRALKQFDRVEELWAEMREAGVAPALLVEGGLVAAGARADQGNLRSAIRLLERSPAPRKGATRPHHLRLWYALGDLYERVGDIPRAREHFGRVMASDRGLADVAERLNNLG